ncbi:MAG: alpha/beta fold hydrolase [Candidatus Eremiobacteraeota bacterium]|nr:alpha/beta fold hydrolase [Candidatus Eremiobacteraeota bacterium]
MGSARSTIVRSDAGHTSRSARARSFIGYGGPYLMETLAADVAALLDALSLDGVALAGHSMGGYVALSFYRMFRERVRGLALVASRAGADTPQAAAGREELAARAEREGIAPVVERLQPRLFAPAVYQEDPALAARTRALLERTDPRGAAAALRGMAVRVDSHDVLEDVDVPFLAIAGAEDALIDVPEVEASAAAVRGATFERFEHCGHMPMLEATKRLEAALERFLP